MSNALIKWPIQFASASYTIRIHNGTAAETINFPTVTVGRNYWMGADGQQDAVGAEEGVGDLVLLLWDALDSSTVRARNDFQLTLNTDTLRFGITNTSGADCIIYGDHANTTLDMSIFGFPFGDFAIPNGATTYGPNQPQGIWSPDRPVAVDSRPKQKIVGGVSRTISGKQRVSRIATPKKERRLEFRLLNQTQCLDEHVAADEPYGSFEYAWTNHISKGEVFRLHEDKHLLDYGVYRSTEVDDPLERSGQYNIYWDAKLSCVEERAPGLPGDNAIVLDGTTDSYTINTSYSIAGTTSFVASLWFKTTASANTVLFGQHNSAGDAGGMYCYLSGAERVRIFFGASVNWLAGVVDHIKSGWNHLVIYYNGAGAGNSTRLYVYQNGVDITGNGAFTSTIPTSVATESAAMMIGDFASGGQPEFNGSIRDFFIANNKTTTPQAVTLAYNRGRGRDPKVLLSTYTSGTAAADLYFPWQGDDHNIGTGTKNWTPNGDPTSGDGTLP